MSCIIVVFYLYYLFEKNSYGSPPSCPLHISRIYVLFLSCSFTPTRPDPNLYFFRREAGEVIYCDVMKERDGRSKGCGIVEFSTPEEAQEAIKTLTDTEIKGRMIFVREDRETTSSAGGFGNRGGCNVYVGNLSYETSWQDLKDVSYHFAPVSSFLVGCFAHHPCPISSFTHNNLFLFQF